MLSTIAWSTTGRIPARRAGPGEYRQSERMSVPLSQMWTVASYVLAQKLRGRKRYPLVLMLEPLFRCNLACAGCGKIQYPAQILRKHLTVEQCLRGGRRVRRADRVAFPGGEPLMHPEIDGSSTDWSRGRSTSTSAPTPSCSKEKLDAGSSRRRSTSPSASTWTGSARSTTRPSAATACTTRPSQAIREALAARLPRHDQHHALRRRRSRADAAVLRRDDGPRRRGHDGLPRLQLREGARPGALPPRAARDTSSSAASCRARSGGGSSTSRRCSSSSSWASGTSSARRGATRPTTSSAGSGRATCSRRATRRRFEELMETTAGSATAGGAATRSATTAWSTAATSRRPSTTPSRRWRGFRGHGGGHRHRARLSWRPRKHPRGWAPEPDAEMPLAQHRRARLRLPGQHDGREAGRHGARRLRLQPRRGRAGAVRRRCSTPRAADPHRFRTRRSARSSSPGRTRRPASRTPHGLPGSRRRRSDGRRAHRRRDAGVELTREGRVPRRRRPRAGGPRIAPAAAAGHPAGADRPDRGPSRDPPRPSRHPPGLAGARRAARDRARRRLRAGPPAG